MDALFLWTKKDLKNQGVVASFNLRKVHPLRCDHLFRNNPQKALLLLSLLLIASPATPAVRPKVLPGGLIRTIAGSGPAGLLAIGQGGFAGDGGAALLARFNFPEGLALGPDGTLFVADTGNNRIRKISPEGIVTTYVGTQRGGYNGDGPADQVSLWNPCDIVLDAQGNLYIADTGNAIIRKVTPDGQVITIAGTPRRHGYGGDNGPATQALLNAPRGLGIDPQGNLYIADTRNQRIRKVTPDGLITTLAGTGKMGFSGDGGPALQAQLRNPMDVAVDAQGNIFIADTHNFRIRKVTPDGLITTICGTGKTGFNGEVVPALQALLGEPQGIALDSRGNLYIADSINFRIRRLSPEGLLTTIVGTNQHGFEGDGGPSSQAQVEDMLMGILIDQEGNLYFSDSSNHRVRKVWLHPRPGDLDGDDRLTLQDVRWALKLLRSPSPILTEGQLRALGKQENPIIALEDVIRLLRQAVGLDPLLPSAQQSQLLYCPLGCGGGEPKDGRG